MIRFDNIRLGYGSRTLIENLSAELHRGQLTALVGRNGSGKSTFIKLLCRLYDPTEGEILIDGVNIKDISQNALRSQIGVVLQETHLFSGSIRDNISYSKPMASNEEIIEAARVANAHDFICKLPDGYSTYGGEKGHNLSGGEKAAFDLLLDLRFLFHLLLLYLFLFLYFLEV